MLYFLHQNSFSFKSVPFKTTNIKTISKIQLYTHDRYHQGTDRDHFQSLVYKNFEGFKRVIDDNILDQALIVLL